MRTSVLRTRVAPVISGSTRRRFVPSASRRETDLTSTARATDPHPLPEDTLPFQFETGLALFAKRLPRPFPPPFLSPPSGSFSDPLSTHDRSRDRRAFVNGELIRGFTNGDDAVYASNHFIAANDGVGAWATRPGGHAGLVPIGDIPSR